MTEGTAQDFSPIYATECTRCGGPLGDGAEHGPHEFYPWAYCRRCVLAIG